MLGFLRLRLHTERDGFTYSSHFDGDVAATTADVHNGSFEVCPGVIVSQLDDVIYRFIVICQYRICPEISNPRAAVQLSQV